MTHAYNELYLNDAKETLSEFFDYGITDNKMDADMLAQIFSHSVYGSMFEKGNPSVIGGMSGEELFVRVMEKAYPEYRPAKTIVKEGKTMAYWAGWALAQYQWASCRRFKDIFSKIPFSEIIGMYNIYHEMDVQSFIEEVELRYKERSTDTNLKKMRKNRGISQAKLSEISGVNIRSIQMYEQKINDIDKAQANAVFKLSLALGCDIEDILESPAK